MIGLPIRFLRCLTKASRLVELTPKQVLLVFNRVLSSVLGTYVKNVRGIAPVVELRLSREGTTCRLHIESLRVSLECKCSADDTFVSNPLFSPQLAEYFRKYYWCRFPLWSRLALGLRSQMTNATAEAGARVLKFDERALPHKGERRLRVDEYISARIPTREAQCRLLLAQVKQNRQRSIRKQSDSTASSLSAMETWFKPAPLSLSDVQAQLHVRLQQVVHWRKSNGASLDVCRREVLDGAGNDNLALSYSHFNKMVNRKAWPAKDDVIDAIAAWVNVQYPKLPGLFRFLCAAPDIIHAAHTTDGPRKPKPRAVGIVASIQRQRAAAAAQSTQTASSDAHRPVSTSAAAVETRTSSHSTDGEMTDAPAQQSAVHVRSTRAVNRQPSGSLPGQFLFVKLEIDETVGQRRPFGIVRYLRGDIQLDPPRDPNRELVGEVWLPVDAKNLLGSYYAKSPVEETKFPQGAVLYFDERLDTFARPSLETCNDMLSVASMKRAVSRYEPLSPCCKAD